MALNRESTSSEYTTRQSINIPGFLYQYTSINTLALILATKKLKFSRLDQCNDPEEANCPSIPDAMKHVFVSCWTDNGVDTIPMWSMYGNHLGGVRIGFPTQMFLDQDSIKIWSPGGATFCIQQPVSFQREGNCNPFYTQRIYGPNPITYSPTPSDTQTEVKFEKNQIKYISLENLALAKNTPWDYEKEWRFRIFATPTLSMSSNEFEKLISNPPIERAVYLDLNPTIFNHMEILLGPKTNDGDRIITTSLVNLYAPGANVLKSSIRIR